MIATKDNVEIVSGYKVKAADTVLAGDNFNGAVTVALMEGKTLQETVKFANAMGACRHGKRLNSFFAHEKADGRIYFQ